MAAEPARDCSNIAAKVHGATGIADLRMVVRVGANEFVVDF